MHPTAQISGAFGLGGFTASGRESGARCQYAWRAGRAERATDTAA